MNNKIKKLKIITWNILFDNFFSKLIFTKERTIELLKNLKEYDVDIIALQEVIFKFF